MELYKLGFRQSNAIPDSQIYPISRERRASDLRPSWFAELRRSNLTAIRNGLKDLRLADGATLFPPFGDQHRNIIGNYSGNVVVNPIRIIPTAKEDDATINIYVSTVTGKTVPDQTITSGDTSAPITLREDGVTRIVLEVLSGVGGSETVHYPLYIRSTDYFDLADRDDNGFTEIYYLEHLSSIDTSTGLSGNYELIRDLDFNDPDSYFIGQAAWRVADFDSTAAANIGWIAIGNTTTPFSGEFEGNGYQISGLQINRDSQNHQGLFGVIGSSGVVRNLSLTNVRIEGGSQVGAIVGTHRGQINNSHAAGIVSGVANVGGMVGDATANSVIVNSRGDIQVSASGTNAGGILGRCVGCTVLNSFSVGAVSGRNQTEGFIGGFIGRVESGSNIANNYAWGDGQ